MNHQRNHNDNCYSWVCSCSDEFNYFWSSLPSPVHPAHLRDGNEDAREGAASPLHASLSTSLVAPTCTHMPPYAFLPSFPSLLSDLLCVCVFKATKICFGSSPTFCISVEHPGCVRGRTWVRLKFE